MRYAGGMWIPGLSFILFKVHAGGRFFSLFFLSFLPKKGIKRKKKRNEETNKKEEAMPLLTLNERLSQDLLLLSKLPSREYVSEFCKQALESLGVGSRKSTLKNAADALSLDLDTVSGAIMALSFLFIESAKVSGLEFVSYWVGCNYNHSRSIITRPFT